jgi:hypothetical protein
LLTRTPHLGKSSRMGHMSGIPTSRPGHGRSGDGRAFIVLDSSQGRTQLPSTLPRSPFLGAGLP